MIFRKVTRKTVLSTVAMLAVGFLNMSCSNEEFEEQGMRMTLATRCTTGVGEPNIYVQSDSRAIDIPFDAIGGSLPVRINWTFGKISPIIESTIGTNTSSWSMGWSPTIIYPHILDSYGDTINGPLNIEDVRVSRVYPYWLPQTLSIDMHTINVGVDVDYSLLLKIYNGDSVSWLNTEEYHFKDIETTVSGLRITDNPNQ